MARIRQFSDEPAYRTSYQHTQGLIYGDRRHSDDQRLVEHYEPSSTGGELSVWQDRSQTNEEIPDNLAFVAQGTTAALNPGLDERIHELRLLAGQQVDTSRRSMNAADFRERCIVHNNRLYALYERRAGDLQPVWYKDQFQIAKKLNCCIDIATKIVEIIKDGGMDRKTAHRLFYGYTMSNGERRGGLMSLKGQNEILARTIDWIESLYLTSEYKERDYGKAPNQMDAYYDERMIYHMDLDGPDLVDAILHRYHPEETAANEEANWDDGLDQVGDSNPYSAFPLSDGRDGVNYEFIVYIKTANVKTIGQIQKMFFNQNNPYSGKIERAKLRHLTATQKSICWGFIKDRKKKLVKMGLKALDAQGRQVLRMAREMGKNMQTRGMIAAWANGGTFDMAGVDIDFERKPSELETFAMWSFYRNL